MKQILKKVMLLQLVIMLFVSSNGGFFVNLFAKTSGEQEVNTRLDGQPLSINDTSETEELYVFKNSKKMANVFLNTLLTETSTSGITQFRIEEDDFVDKNGVFDHLKKVKVYNLTMSFNGFPEDSTPDKNKKIVISLNKQFKFTSYPKPDGYNSIKSVSLDTSTATLTYILEDDLENSGNFTLDFTIKPATYEIIRNSKVDTAYTLDAKYFCKSINDESYPTEPTSQQNINFTYPEFNKKMVAPSLEKVNEYNIIGFHADDYNEPIKVNLYPQGIKVSETNNDSARHSNIQVLNKIEDVFLKTPQLVLPLPEGVEFYCDTGDECKMGNNGGMGKMEGDSLVITFYDQLQKNLFPYSGSVNADIEGYFKFRDPTPGKLYTSTKPATLKYIIMGKEYELPLSESVNFRIPKQVDSFKLNSYYTNNYPYNFYGDPGEKVENKLLLNYTFETRFSGSGYGMINDTKPMEETKFEYTKKNEQLSPTYIAIGADSDSGKAINWFYEFGASATINVEYTDGSTTQFNEQDFKLKDDLDEYGRYAVNINPDGKTVKAFDVVFKNLNFRSIENSKQKIEVARLYVYGDINFVDNSEKPLTEKLPLETKEYSITPLQKSQLDYNSNAFVLKEGAYVDLAQRILNPYIDDIQMDDETSLNSNVDISSGIQIWNKIGVSTIGATNGEARFYLKNTDKSITYKNMKVHPKIGSAKEADSNLLMPMYDQFFFGVADHVDYGDAVFTLSDNTTIRKSIDKDSTISKPDSNSSLTYKLIDLNLEEGIYVKDYYFMIDELRRPSSLVGRAYYMCRASEELTSNVLKDGTKLDITVDEKEYKENYLQVVTEITSDSMTGVRKFSGFLDDFIVAYSELVSFGEPEVFDIKLDTASQATGNMSVPIVLTLKTKNYVYEPNIILKVDSKFKIDENSILVTNDNSDRESKSTIKSYFKDGNQYISIGLASNTIKGHTDTGSLKVRFNVFISPELPSGKVVENHTLISDIYLSGDETISKDYIIINENNQVNQAYTFKYDLNTSITDDNDMDEDGDKTDLIMHSSSALTIPIHPIKEFGIFSNGSSSLVNNTSEITVHGKDEVSVKHIFNGNSESTVSDIISYIPIPKKNRKSLIAVDNTTKEVIDEFESYLTKEVSISNPDLNKDNIEVLYTTSKDPDMKELYENSSENDSNYVPYDEVKQKLDEVTMVKVIIKKLGKDNTEGISKIVVQTNLRLPEKDALETLTSYQNIRYKAKLEGEGNIRYNQFANTVKINLIDYTLKGSLWYDRNYDNEIGDKVKNDELTKIKIHLKNGANEQASTDAIFNSVTKTYDYSLVTPSIKADTKLVLNNIPSSLNLIYAGDDRKQNSSFDRNTRELSIKENLSKAEIDNLNAGFSDVRSINGEDISMQQGERIDLKSKTLLDPSYLFDELGIVAKYTIKSGTDIITLNGTQIEAIKSGEAVISAKIENGLYKEDGSVDGYIEKEIKVEVYAKRISVSIPREMKFQVVTNTNTGSPEFVTPTYNIENLASAVDVELSNITDNDPNSKLRLTHNAEADNSLYEMTLGIESQIGKTPVQTDISIDDMDLQNFKSVPLGQLNGFGSDGDIANLTFVSDKFESTDFPEKPSDAYTRNMNLIFKFALHTKR